MLIKERFIKFLQDYINSNNSNAIQQIKNKEDFINAINLFLDAAYFNTRTQENNYRFSNYLIELANVPNKLNEARTALNTYCQKLQVLPDKEDKNKSEAIKIQEEIDKLYQQYSTLLQLQQDRFVALGSGLHNEVGKNSPLLAAYKSTLGGKALKDCLRITKEFLGAVTYLRQAIKDKTPVSFRGSTPAKASHPLRVTHSSCPSSGLQFLNNLFREYTSLLLTSFSL